MRRIAPVLAGLASFTLGVRGSAGQQDAPAVDWQALVVKACEHPRYGMRRALAARIARAGDAAVEAILSYAKQRGENAVPLLLVDAVARSGRGGPQTLALLGKWADDPVFYWRAIALEGLALRADRNSLPRFRAALIDPSHLQRLAGAKGLWLAGEALDRERALTLLQDPDPRARVRFAAFLLDRGERSGVAVLVAAVPRTDAFFGDPWASREARQALAALERAAGTDFGDLGDAGPAAAAAAAWFGLGPFSGPPEPAGFVSGKAVLGVEVRSCRHGDLFLTVTEDRRVLAGLDPRPIVRLAEEALGEVLARLGDTIQGRVTRGRVVCDYLQVVLPGAGRLRCAPGHLAAALEDALERLAAALAAAGTPAFAAGLRRRLGQFRRP